MHFKIDQTLNGSSPLQQILLFLLQLWSNIQWVAATWRYQDVSSRKIYCLMTSSSRQVYDDGLCLQRAVPFHLTRTHNLQEQTANPFHRYVEHSKINNAEVQGVSLESVNDIEDFTELNISIYDIELDN